MLFGVSLGNVHRSGDSERVIGNDRRGIQISSESRGYGREEAGPHSLLTFSRFGVSSDTCQVERDLGLHELLHRFLEEDCET